MKQVRNIFLELKHMIGSIFFLFFNLLKVNDMEIKFNAMPLDYYKLPPTDFSAPETSMKKCGRGSAKGIHQWGTGTKLKVMFDNDFQPLGDEGSRLKGQLGTMLRNPHRVPLTYLDWNSVPEEIKSAIWKEIEVYVIFFEFFCLHIFDLFLYM